MISQKQARLVVLVKLHHYCQWFHRGAPRKFDYGILRNQIFYNKTIPPEYNFDNINVPLYIFYGNEDYLATPMDVRILLNRLGNKVKNTTYYNKGRFSHNDFIFAKNVNQLVNAIVITNSEQNIF